ncbi:putative L-ascorbate peroxidase 6 [Chenopodium quinoa]|uniref:putative L-ascorbate peroxidase 6 n=1 Tax=Chenopodium quinoa TaxID=63459 RepID=UPI000B77A391|nr:putative L-ascorbate peroxidase 6 [Chenopodium quinoa]
MTTTGGESSIFRGCFATLKSSNPLNKFKFPAKTSPSTVQFGAKVAPFLSPTSALPPTSDGYGNLGSCGRRGLIFLSVTLPSLFPLQEYVKDFNAEAEELGAPDYLLIKDEIRKVLSKGKAAGVLRLVFHDAGTFELSENSGGMNGSITYELERPENKGLKKSLKIIEKAKNVVDERQSVSWADMIAVAGAEAVSICGGPDIPVRLGRLDSLTPDPEEKLPEESLDAPSLKQCFQRKGFSTQELVALSGAHTLGSKGFGSPIVFDNSYYKILLEKPWLSSAGMSSMVGLPSDRALVEDDECLRWITNYANDQDLFFEDFKNVYIKLVNSGVRWKSS